MAQDIRLTILLSAEEHRELKRRAGLVPLSTWVRARVFEGHGTQPMTPVPAKATPYRGDDPMPTFVPDVEDVDEGGSAQDVQRVPEIAPVERRTAVRRDSAPRPEHIPTAPLFSAGAHPGSGIFNAPTDLNEPAYKSHEDSCHCPICVSAIKAGLKEDSRPKKEEKKPAKKGRR